MINVTQLGIYYNLVAREKFWFVEPETNIPKITFLGLMDDNEFNSVKEKLLSLGMEQKLRNLWLL
jgi:hypothetical protein